MIHLLKLCFIAAIGLAVTTPAVIPAAWAESADIPPQAGAPFLGKKIVAIEVRGNRRIEKDAIAAKLESKVGAELTRDNIRLDIQNLFSMGYFDDIEVGAEAATGGVKLTVDLKERPVIAKIVFDGNERISTTDLEEVVKVKQWSILDYNKVKEDTSLIQKHYEEKGYYLAKVDFQVKALEAGKNNAPDEVELTYRINDYEKVRIKKITFLNNKQFGDDKLKSILGETKEGGLLSFVSGSGSFKESAFKQDLQRLTYWYLEHGYVKFRFDNPVVNVSDDKKWLYVTIYVEEGEAYKIGKLKFSGDLLYPVDELHSELSLKEDDVFAISKRNADIQKLTEKYQDLGYAFTNVIPKMNINDETKTVDIDYSFEKGSLVYFGEINVKGNSKTHDKVIRRELKIKEGELYSGSKLRISRENVERLGYFQPGEVIFNTQSPEGKTDILDVEIEIKERSTGTITLGAGYGSVQGFFLQTQVQEINFRGRGQTLSFSAQLARDNRAKSFNLGFTDPYSFDTRWVLGFDLFYVFFPIPQKYGTRRFGSNLRVGYPIADYSNLFFTYKIEDLRVIETNPGNSQADIDADNGILSAIVVSVVHDKRNNRFETTSGDYRSISLEGAGIGGDKRFLKWTANSRYYRKVVGDLVFRNNVELGQIYQLGDEIVPPAERFYLGGPNNMRGFNLFSVGPFRERTDGSGNIIREPVGGTTQMLALTELEYPVLREAGLKLVTFLDIGNAFVGLPSLDRFNLRMNWGWGFRWFSPIGPLRFEWGYPINKKSFEQNFVFQFFIGPPF